ncbi:MAG: type 4a pilus biogenesis protein PilO [Pseudomonadota bacterium]|nr:MAG: type 4a pilus biogenesis protein PilO [Pseudomonadota bacterium]
MPFKIIVISVLCIIVFVGGYFLFIQSQQERLERVRAEETSLKQDFETKQAKAANLDAYKEQMKEMEETFGTMLRQLPSKTEVENLVDEISQTGLTSGVEFQLFKPRPEQAIDFYAEKPINIKVTGGYHQFGDFISGVAALPRIVTLHNIKIERDDKSGQLAMEVVAKTYRYLDEDEIAEQRAAKKKQKKGRRK